MEWLIAAGLHPRATATTLRVAEDLADRMDYTTGHVRYCLDEMAVRLDLSRATVKRHIGYLRELGALAWVQHGTRTNIRRLLGMKGYAATATVYAAVIPPVYDEAMGHTLVGSGYSARIVVDLRGRRLPAPRPAATPVPLGEAGIPVDNPPVDNSSSAGLEPPSLTTVDEGEGKVKVEGGSNYTSRERVSEPPTSLPRQTTNSSSSEGSARRRTPAQVQREIRETRLVRALVNWTQGERIRRLAFVLRPYFDRGLGAHDIAAELIGMPRSSDRWRPKYPAAYIASVTSRDSEDEAARAAVQAAIAGGRSITVLQEWKTAVDTVQAAFAEPERTDADRAHARQYGWDQWETIAAHYDEDPDDALDLYGGRLVTYAVGRQARQQWT
ncbi:cell wall protein [Streptomyces europaeiscabiei]|uniref:cell wall protein n=1 Tax=Streptomyces europaeiscabiei TaxID=146819 RepID=UPI002E26883F|nr:cell wall protein [Streptomyces europaeiscabiei]